MANTNEHAATSMPLAKTAEVATHLSVSRAKVYQLMDEGILPYVKFGRCRRIRWPDVDALIANHLVAPT
jgi:excisionase family DNA binding protein